MINGQQSGIRWVLRHVAMADQAFGAGRLSEIGTIFQRCILFLLLHSIPVAALFMAIPQFLAWLGQAPLLRQEVGAYVFALLPTLAFEALIRFVLSLQPPVSSLMPKRCLVIQRMQPNEANDLFLLSENLTDITPMFLCSTHMVRG